MVIHSLYETSFLIAEVYTTYSNGHIDGQINM